MRALALATLQLLALPGTLDTCVRLALRGRRRRSVRPQTARAPQRVVVLVPARFERDRIRTTLASVALAAARRADVSIEVVVLLDGDDAHAERVARDLGATVVIKRPAGPTKAAALRWFALEHRAVVESAGAIVILDAGTGLSPDFFVALNLDGCDAMQAEIQSAGSGLPGVISESESRAFDDDRDRVAAGWNARLRGSGTICTPAFFLSLAPALFTQTEDWEMSLLAGTRGLRIGIAPDGCAIFDTKPADPDAASRQRARWLTGQLELITRRYDEILRFIVRDPLQGLAFTAELLDRPHSLALPLRAAAGIAVAALGRRSTAARVTAAIILGAVALEVFRWSKTARAGSMVGVWLDAVSHLPEARDRWLRVSDP